MKIIDTLNTMLGRMTSRERRLFAILAGSLVTAIVVVAYLLTAAVFGSIQEDIDHGRQVLAEARQLAPHYQELAETRRQLEDAIRSNRSSVRVTANELLKRIEMTGEVPGAVGNKLSDIVSFEGKTTETPLDTSKGGKKTPRKGKGKDSSGGIVEVEQNLEFRELPVESLFQFLDSVEAAKDLLFITRVDAGRKFNDLSHVRSTVTIATFVNQTEEAAPEPGAAAGANE